MSVILSRLVRVVFVVGDMLLTKKYRLQLSFGRTRAPPPKTGGRAGDAVHRWDGS
eukprot:SAG22_NODE_7986_length_693_cov_1.020202_3_plen_54_part_01